MAGKLGKEAGGKRNRGPEQRNYDHFSQNEQKALTIDPWLVHVIFLVLID